MNTILPAQQSFKWKVFWIGLVLYLAAAVAGIPLALAMRPLAEGESWLNGASLELVEYLLVGVLSLGIGLYLAGRMGLGLPFIEGWVDKEPVWDRFRGVLGLSLITAIVGSLTMLILGLALTMVLVALEIVPPNAVLEAGAWAEPYPAPWKWFLVSINAGVTEEIAFRLGLMTLLAWLGSMIGHDGDGRPTPAVVWTANVLAALAFGAAHLVGIIPVPLMPVFILRTVVQNGIVGTVFGWLYWKRGLESAMLAHFFFDAATYVVLLPVIQSSNLLLMVLALIGLALAAWWAWHAMPKDKKRVEQPDAREGPRSTSRRWRLIGTIAAIAVGTTMCLGVLVQLGLQSHGSWAQDLEPTQTPHPKLGIGSTRVSEVDGMTMVYVPAGDAVIGSRSFQRSERPPHTVYLDAFWIDKTEVTNGMYERCVADGACTPPARSSSSTRLEYHGNPQYDDYPLIYVDWQQANAYCEWAGRRLPTEAEWEKAARGSDERRYPWGDAAPDNTLLNYDGYVKDTAAVGSYPDGASPYGALDMMGNVLEWVADCYGSGYYAHSPRQNPTGPAPCEHKHRVIRGGCSWAGLVSQHIGAADRLNDLERTVYPDRGFRCALSPSSASTAATEGRIPVLEGEYLGQSKPGLTPEPFAPEIFSTAGHFHYNLHSSVYFSSDGKVFFTNQMLEPLETTILFIEELESGVWTEPQVFPPPEGYGEDLMLLPDGKHRLYVYSKRSIDGSGEEQGDYTLWLVDRTQTGWSEPYSLADVDEDQGPVYFSADVEGGLGDNDIYRSEFVDGGYAEPENLGDPPNSEFSDTVLCVAPDESYLILYRFHDKSRTVRGLYLSVRRPDDSWTEPVHLDEEFGFGLGFDASLSPDGKYLFFLDRGTGVYWVDAKVVENFR